MGERVKRGTFIAALRQMRGKSQKQLAAELGTDQGTISRMESGQRGLSVEVAEKAAPMAGCTAAEALVGDAILSAKAELERGQTSPAEICRHVRRLDAASKSKDAGDAEGRAALREGAKMLCELMASKYSEQEITAAIGESGRPDENPARDGFGRSTAKLFGSAPRDVKAREVAAAKRADEPAAGVRDGFGRQTRKIHS